MATQRICSVPECGNVHYGLGWCSSHYQRLRRHGSLTAKHAVTPSVKAVHGEPDRYLKEVVLQYDGDDCLIWPYYRSHGGYGRLRRAGKPFTVSRLVCEAANGPPPMGNYDAAHSCGNGDLGCCTKRHLSWKTRKENLADEIDHGTRHSRLTASDVRMIRLMASKVSRQRIAEQFGVVPATISAILKGRSWSWLE